MLNKTAEKVLKCIIKKSNGNYEELISVSHKDFKDKSITNDMLNSICRQLYNDGYIRVCYPCCGEDDDIDLILKYEGHSYFDNKRTTLFRMWIPIMISLVALIKSFLPELIWLLQAVMKLLK